MTPNPRHALGLAALAAVAIAGCGSGHGPPRAVGYASSVVYSDCMRAHGVTSFPDPGPEGGLDIPSTINVHSPAYRSADQTCSRLQPSPIPRRIPTERQKLLAVAFSRCVRSRGIPDFPDPTPSVPPPAQAHGILRGGLYWPMSAGVVQSPAFRAAAAACGLHVTGGVAAAAG
jgi:hypothetical protein